jgi:hypothetical protein
MRKILAIPGAAWEVLTFLTRDPIRHRLDNLPMAEVTSLAERGALTVREMERLLSLQAKIDRLSRAQARQ